jgi:basic membrane protein A and related proteins
LRRVTTFAATILAGALALTACGGSSTSSASPADDSSGSSSASSSAKSDLKVGLAYDIGGRGDQSFNDSAAAGLDKAKTDLGVETKEAEASSGEAESAKEERLRALAGAGYNPVIAVGFAYSGAVTKVAKENPDVHFAIIDDPAKGANITNLLFAENEGSFLVGAAAALKDTKNNVGFIGGVDVPLIHKFEAGFKAGAEAAKPGIKVQVKYLTQPPDFSGFGAPDKGKTAATGMYDAGADVVFAAAGGSGGGVFDAAKSAGALAIGTDSDQYKTADPTVQSVIMTSMLKKVDVAVFDFVKAASEDSYTAGVKTYDLKAGGVDYSTTGGQVDDIKTKLDDYKKQIIDGAITVPTK